MKLTPKASLAFKSDSASAKTTFGDNVINCLTPLTTVKKSVFTINDLPYSVADLRIVNNNLIAAAAARVDGGRAATNNLKTARQAWDIAYTATANYISQQAAGNVADIISSGFIPTKSDSQPAQVPGVPAAFKATINGSKGAIIAGSKTGVATAKAYVTTAIPPEATVSYVKDTMVITLGGARIFLTANTKAETELYNLPSGVPYTVSMFAINAAGSGSATASQQVIPQ